MEKKNYKQEIVLSLVNTVKNPSMGDLLLRLVDLPNSLPGKASNDLLKDTCKFLIEVIVDQAKQKGKSDEEENIEKTTEIPPKTTNDAPKQTESEDLDRWSTPKLKICKYCQRYHLNVWNRCLLKLNKVIPILPDKFQK